MILDIKSGLWVPRRRLCSLFPAMHGIAGAGGGVSYAANGVNFDGTNDYLTRGADLTGNADGKVGTASFWVNFNGGNNLTQLIYGTPGTPKMSIRKQSDNTFRFLARDTGGTIILSFDSVVTYVSGATWYNILASWDLANAGSGRLRVNDVSDYSENTFTDDTIDYTNTDHSIGAGVGGSSKINACLADFWFDPTGYLDFDTVANRRKFIDASGNPVDLGSDGSTPTGTAPLMFFSGDTAGWETNLGSGGGFTENGALTDCATDP